MERTPVTVIGGYLGAGKTTLVNHLLRHAQGLRLAVLVNDFGDLPIDADLIESSDGSVISIAGGCICCSFGSDLMAALMALSERTPGPEHLLIETSGVALPGAVARSVKLLAHYALDGIVVLADAETVRARAADRYMGDTIARQLADADLIVLNRADLVAPAALEAARAWLRAQWPQARVLPSVRARLPPEALLGTALARPQRKAQSGLDAGRLVPPAGADAAALFESASFSAGAALDLGRLARELAALDLLRVKGLLKDLDGCVRTLQLVGARWELGAPATGARGGSRLVCIGLKGSLDRAAIAQAIASATAH